MIRCMSAVSLLAFLAGSAWAGQEKPAGTKSDVIKELERSFEEARTGLQKDAGAKTRAAHRRIIAGLDELLKSDEPAQPPVPSKSPPPANKPLPPPAPKSAPESSPLPQAGLGTPGEGRLKDGPWDIRRQRQQEALDAVGRDRLVPRYEELLRAYYRSLAERGE